MGKVVNVNVDRDWEECPRERKEARWAALYATLNPDGDIVISRHTHEKLGSPDSYLLLYDRLRRVIGLRPASEAVEKNAYPARDRGRHGGKRIRGYQMCRHFGISVRHTVRFHHCQIDNDGVLILDLGDVKPAAKGRTPVQEYSLDDDSLDDEPLDDRYGGSTRYGRNGKKLHTW